MLNAQMVILYEWQNAKIAGLTKKVEKVIRVFGDLYVKSEKVSKKYHFW